MRSQQWIPEKAVPSEREGDGLVGVGARNAGVV